MESQSKNLESGLILKAFIHAKCTYSSSQQPSLLVYKKYGCIRLRPKLTPQAAAA